MIAELVYMGLKDEGWTPDEIKPVYEALMLLERRLAGHPRESKTMKKVVLLFTEDSAGYFKETSTE